MSKAPQHKTLILACGALAKEIVHLTKQFGQNADLQCLPAGFHNTPQKIVPALKTILDERASDYARVLIGYGDCGTGGGLDALLGDYDNATRIPGAHCYAFYSGLQSFDAMMEDELGTFFLTDYLVKHFDSLIIKGMGLDRFPELRDTYFEHYKKLTYLAQSEDDGLKMAAQNAALRLGLSFEYRYVGYGGLRAAISDFNMTQTATHSSQTQKGLQHV
ncbi:MAG: DUF1638 domain-containing protein [Litorimonas sp.]